MRAMQVYSLATAYEATRDLARSSAHEYLNGRKAGERGHPVRADELRSQSYLRGLQEGYAARADRLYDLSSAAFAMARAAQEDGRDSTRHFERQEHLAALAHQLDSWSGRGR